jgi:hypothetical protein
MPDERKRQTLPPERLREVLDRLNEVLSEAERLRDEITRQISDQHAQQQQHVSKGGKSKKRRKT